MAVTWQWDDKVGDATLIQKFGDDERVFTLNLYNGNCWLIMLNEYEEDGKEMYEMHAFWADKGHMERCLGLAGENKGRNMHDLGWSRITKFRFNKKKCQYLNKMLPAIEKAFDQIEIELYTEE